MKYFPVFMAVENRKIVLSGGRETALAKLRLLLKTEARIEVYASHPCAEIELWAARGIIQLKRRRLGRGDLCEAVLAYAACENEAANRQVAAMARMEGVPVNIVDTLEGSSFITPAIVDRDPVTVAIGTEGAAPVLARMIKAELEARLPSALGILANIGKSFRKAAEILPAGRGRRDFWSHYYMRHGPRALDSGGAKAVREALPGLVEKHLVRTEREGHVTFVGAGPGDPELLTLKARKTLSDADVVIHDRLVSPEILELARREATIIEVGKTGYGPSCPQAKINSLLVGHAGRGDQIVRLKSGDACVFGRLDEEMAALDRAGVEYGVIPGITAASAGAAAIGRSLTKRGRNSSINLLAGHDMAGFAEHDWVSLARPGGIAAIYMSIKSARFIQGRLLMHGAARNTPVTIVENASRTSQRVLAGTLATMATDIAEAEISGPAIIFYGLAASDRQAEFHPEKKEPA
ncbi:MAG: siroheme synthase CysG [Roseovarius sp.]|nr:siroheme synthase CysG [Roseovarius sp.]